MKVKTITCHKVYNHGASLQELALLKFLENEGHDAETIDYTPPYLSNHHNFFAVGNPRFEKNIFLKYAYLLLKLPGRLFMLTRKKAFDDFEEKYIKSTQINYKNNEELTRNLPEADVFICGSDQIWNSFFQNGKDPAFYLDFVPAGIPKVSYAASFAIKKLEQEQESFVSEKVNRLDHISVRENSGKAILKDLGIERVTQVMDPVFLLEKEYWEDNFVEVMNQKFIFVYDCDSNSVIKDIAMQAAREFDLKIYTVNKNISYATKNFYKVGPQKFLSLIHSAQFVISNSFHAVAFSLIFNKKFYVVDRSENINTRMRDIMKVMGLEDMHLQYGEYRECKDIVIDYTRVNEIVSKEVDRSIAFLNSAVLQKP
tara:strand:+ start:3514 stop:4623 length:1110 start_codon:yes stop_codon:yes gene_type:complete